LKEGKMKKRILLVLFVLLLVIPLIEISCQHKEEKGKENTDELEELIEKNINARGGYEKLKAVKSLKITAKYIQGSRETPLILTIKRPNFIYGEILFPSSPMICGYDGKTAWWFNRSQLSEPQTLTAEEALIFTRYAEFGDLFVDYEQKGQKVELTGIEDLDGQKAHKLKITSENGIIRYVYLDAENFLKVKESYRSKNEKDFGLEVIFKDFRAIDGVMFPFYHDITGEQTIIERIEINVDIDDSIFKMPPKTGQTDQLSVSEFVRELDAYLETNTEKDIFSGVVLFACEGKPIFKKAYGMADRERNIPNQLNTKFCIGSMGKMFTAVSIAQLVEQGKLSYDDLIGKYLGADWILSEVGEKVKISHLLSHTSGIAEFLDDEFYKFTEAGTHWTLEDRKPIVKEKSLTFEPGTRWAYCNTGFILLAAIIEKVTGKDYIKEHIFDPADMDNTIGSSSKKILLNVALGYDKVQEEGKAIWRKTGLFGKNGSPSSGGFSTVDDLLNFSEALRTDLLISSESKELLVSVKARSSSIDIEYGYGFIISSSMKFGRVVGHGGAAPGVSANFRLFLDRGYTMIILSNFSEASLPVSRIIRSLLPLK
jgi:CubicO group peptidase (beta-lactamase class C family)/outer membrane lipoprotein-sorting protein